jgi:DNA polymerase
MHRIALAAPHDLAAFRAAARGALAVGLAPETVLWTDGASDGLFDAADLPAGEPVRVPAGFAPLAADVVCHSDPERLALLYRLLWRLTQGERALLADAADPLVARLLLMQKAVRREIHKAHAFVRFRRIAAEDGERYVAWFEPAHPIVERIGPFFTGRFPAMRWSILTPLGSLHWDGTALASGPPLPKSAAPTGDDVESWWRSYYRATFNPARANPRLMQAEMPKRYWRNLPEAEIIPEMLSQAESRAAAMLEALPTMPRKRIAHAAEKDLFATAEPEAADVDLPDLGPNVTIAALRADAADCTRCHLYKNATQTVFGEGPEDAKIVMVGEQPGDQEDIQGRPFVGPAGRLLDRALVEAGIDRTNVYVTNAVKHFKFEPRGKKRIHKKPDRPEIEACKWWLERELKVLRPELIVALGGTAAEALFGRAVKVLSERGRIADDPRGFRMLVTVHPSMILRVPDADKDKAFRDFVRDLKKAA